MCTLENPASQRYLRTWGSLQSLLKQVPEPYKLKRNRCSSKAETYRTIWFSHFASVNRKPSRYLSACRVLHDLSLSPDLSTWVLGFTSADGLSAKLAHWSYPTILHKAPPYHLPAQLSDLFLPVHQTVSLMQVSVLKKKSPSGISKCSCEPNFLFAFRYSVDWSQQWLPMNWTLQNISKSVAVLSFILRVFLNANYVPSMAPSVRDSKGNTETRHSGVQSCVDAWI